MPHDPALSAAALVASMLRRSQAHVGLAALGEIELGVAGRRPDGFAHSIFEVVDHLRRTAEDLVEYVERSDYSAPSWPEDYWPPTPAPASSGQWEESLCGLDRAIDRMVAILEDPNQDLHAPVPTAEDPSHHPLRCALVLLDHDAYHLGQVVDLRRALGDWPPGSRDGSVQSTP